MNHSEVTKSNRSSPIRILIADDSKFIHKTISDIIDDFFVRVEIDQVTKLIDLPDALRKNEYHIIFLDLLFPKGNSMEKIREIKKRFPFIFICAMSSQSDIRLALKTIDLGSDFYLIKDDQFISDLLNVLQTLRTRIKRQEQLKLMINHIFNKDTYPTLLMKVDETGESVIFKDFEEFPEEIGNLDVFIKKINISFLVALGQGDTYHTGVYQLPAGESQFYNVYDYAFRLDDPNVIDQRLDVGYFHYLIFTPKSFVNIFPSTSQLETQLEGIEDLFSTASQITEQEMYVFKDIVFSRIKEFKMYIEPEL